MTDSRTIYRKAMRLRKKGFHDLLDLAETEGIVVLKRDNFKQLLGMYTAKMRLRIILLNSRAEEPLKSMILAHEIGHDQLHRDIARFSFLKENTLFLKGDRTEYEANAFAAHLLISEEEMLTYLRFGTDIKTTASILNVDVNLLLIKLKEMMRMGMDLQLPFEPDAAFFRNIQV